MDYKKAYEEALERAKAGKPMDEVFPELAESEDERIRKVLIDMVKRETGFTGFPSQGQVLAYIEKKKPSVEEILIKAGLPPYKDGTQWCILIGNDLQEGICGFGDTIDDALYHLLIDAIAYQKKQKSSEEQPELPGYDKALLDVKSKVDELYEEASIGLCEYDSGLYNGIAETCMKLRGFIKARLGSDEQPEVDLEKEEFVGVAESPLKTFPRVNDFECGGSYRH